MKQNLKKKCNRKKREMERNGNKKKGLRLIGKRRRTEKKRLKKGIENTETQKKKVGNVHHNDLKGDCLPALVI